MDDEAPNARITRRARDARVAATYRTARAVAAILAGQSGMVPRRPHTPTFDLGTYRRLIGHPWADVIGPRGLMGLVPHGGTRAGRAAGAWQMYGPDGAPWPVEAPDRSDDGYLTPDEHLYLHGDLYDRDAMRERSRVMGAALRAQRYDVITTADVMAQSVDRRSHRELGALLRERDAWLRERDAYVPREDVIDRRSGLLIIRADRVALRSRQPLTQTLIDARGTRRTRTVIPTRVMAERTITTDTIRAVRHDGVTYRLTTIIDGYRADGTRRGWIGHDPIHLAPSVRSLRAARRHKRTTIGASARGPLKRDIWTLAERSLARRAADAPRDTRDAARAWLSGLPVGASVDTGYGATVTRHDRAIFTVSRDDIRDARRLSATHLAHALAAAASA